MSIQLAGETASFSFSDCICDSPFTLESKLGRGISFVVVFLYFQTVKLNDYLLKATSTSSFNFPLICSVICWNLHFSKWLFVCYAFLVMFFLSFLLWFLSEFLLSEVSAIGITKPYPVFWPLTFIFSYRRAWEGLLSKVKLSTNMYSKILATILT